MEAKRIKKEFTFPPAAEEKAPAPADLEIQQ